jgi:DNA-binding MarR family transcriptional regulator/GNAT superfamily N-acetyltransferase
MMPTTTEVLRRFNRTYTQRIGALDESFLGLGLPLGSARLVFEIGEGGATVRDLRSRLGLDSGQLARQLRRLEDDGLVTVAPDVTDRRRRTVLLTRKGRGFRRRLDDRSEQLAERLVAPLTARQQERLTAALATADLLVRAATVEIASVHPAAPEARSAVRSYFDELDARFPTGFDPGDHHDDETMAPGSGAFVVASSEGAPVACGGVQRLGDAVGEIKRMWVHPDWRGAGLGARLLRHLEQVAADLGHTTVRLDTNGTLVEAIAMYERAGYHRIERYNDNPFAQAWFEKRLVTARGRG